MFTVDCYTGQLPKRGDLLQTNLGDSRERTWMVVHVHNLLPEKGVPRCKVWAVRWWELEPELRLRLFRSAERAGGQKVVYFTRYPAKRRKSFEQYMRRERV